MVFRQIQYQAGRFMNALSVGTRAGLMAYQGVSPYDVLNTDYDSYQARVWRYDVYEKWYNNTMFSTLDAYATRMRTQNSLYKNIRGIYNPVHRLVDLHTSKVYPGQIDWTGGLRVGAVPVVGADKTLLGAIERIFKWSNIGNTLPPYVRGGSKKGDRFWKIIDDTERGRVRMELLDPYKAREVIFDEVGNVKWIAIQRYLVDAEGKEYIEREEIDTNEFRFWKEYNLTAFDNGVKRPPDDRYPNPYGFVPVKHSAHIREEGSPWGRTSFVASLGKIVEVNDQASLAHDAARKALNPIYVAAGGRIPEADSASRERDEIIVLNIPKEATVTTITPQIDPVAILGNIDRLLKEIENDNPELALQGIRDKGAPPSGTAIENSYSDAAGVLIGIQGNCDEGLIGAVKMAISIAAYRGYDDFRMYDPVKSFERGDLDFYIKQRDVFVDRVSTERRIQLLNESADKPTFPVVARDLEYSDEDIAVMMADKAEREAAQAAAAIRATMQQFGMDREDEETDEEEIEDEATATPTIPE